MGISEKRRKSGSKLKLSFQRGDDAVMLGPEQVLSHNLGFGEYESNTCSIELMKSNRIPNERILTVRRIFGEPYSNKTPNPGP